MKKFLLSTILMIMTNTYAQDCAGLEGVYKCVPLIYGVESYELVISNTDGKMKFVSDPFDLTFGNQDEKITEETKGSISCAGLNLAKMVVTVSSLGQAKDAHTGEEYILGEEVSIFSEVTKTEDGNLKIINQMSTSEDLGYQEICTRI